MLEIMRNNLPFAMAMAFADSLSVVLIAVLLSLTLTRRVSRAKEILIWLCFTAVYFVLDSAAYAVSYSFEPLGWIGDMAGILMLMFLLMIPAVILYKEHNSSNIFMLGMAALIALIAAFLTGVVSALVTMRFTVGQAGFYALFSAAKLVVSVAAGVFYAAFILKPARSVIAILDGKMRRYAPVSIASVIFFWGFTGITGYNPTHMTQFVIFYTLMCTMFSIMYWLILSGAIWTSKALKTETELNVASDIQMGMLPQVFPDSEDFNIYAIMQPAKEVGGDFYDIFFIDGDHLAVVIADVSGKGVPAALFMVIAKTLIKNQLQAGVSVEEAMSEVNDKLCEGNQAGMFVTCFMGVLQVSTGEFVYANAGHNPPALRRGNGSFEYVDAPPGFVLAGLTGIRYEKRKVSLKKNDAFFMYTDGITEAMNKKEELFGAARLLGSLDALGEIGNVERQLKQINRNIEEFAGGAEQADDIAMLLLHIL